MIQRQALRNRILLSILIYFTINKMKLNQRELLQKL